MNRPRTFLTLAPQFPIFQAKAIWYTLSAICDDGVSQKEGYVAVIYSIGCKPQKSEENRKTRVATKKVTGSMPLRPTGMLYCHDMCMLHSTSVMNNLAGDNVRLGVQMEAGEWSHRDCQDKLKTIGIATEEFPVTLDGELTKTAHEKWMARRRKKEGYCRNENSIPAGAIDIPMKSDVLLEGLDKQYLLHHGNQQLDELILSKLDLPKRGRGDGKPGRIDDILADLTKLSVRFLKYDDESGMWVEAEKLEARSMIADRFQKHEKLRFGIKMSENHHQQDSLESSGEESSVTAV